MKSISKSSTSPAREIPARQILAPMPPFWRVWRYFQVVLPILDTWLFAVKWGGTGITDRPLHGYLHEFALCNGFEMAGLLWMPPIVAIGDEIRIVDVARYARFPRRLIRDVVGDLDNGVRVYAGGAAFASFFYWPADHLVLSEKMCRRFDVERRYHDVSSAIRQWAFSDSEGSPAYGSVLLQGGELAGKHAMARFLPPDHRLARWRIRPFFVFWSILSYGVIPYVLVKLGYW